MSVTELDLKIARMAIAVWTGETTVALRPTGRAREILAFRRNALSEAILERQCIVASPEYGAEHFREANKKEE